MKRFFFIGVSLFFSIALFAQKTEISTSQIVDLGLSVKWAGWNVGATSPEKYGKLYGWADPTGLKSSDNLNDYPSANPPTDITGTSYDIARVKWGGDWRIPTKNEMEELVRKCKWTRVTYRKVKGFKVTGPNGNSIFMPLTGSDCKSGSPGGFGITGNYWTSCLCERDNKKAYGLFFDSDHGVDDWLWESYRYFGKSIRPVMGQSNSLEKNTPQKTEQVSAGIPIYENTNPRTEANVKFEKTIVRLKPFNVDETKSVVFHFTNLGDSTLVIKRKFLGCPCTKFGKVTETVEPGKRGSIEILFGGSGVKEGYHQSTISILTNFSNSFLNPLFIEGYIAPEGMDPEEYVRYKKEQDAKELKEKNERIRQEKIKEYENRKREK